MGTMRDYALAFARTLHLSADSEDQIARTVPTLCSPAANFRLKRTARDIEAHSARRHERVVAVLTDLGLHRHGHACWATTALLREALTVETLSSDEPTPAPGACAGVLLALVRLQASRYELLANWAAAAELEDAACGFARSMAEHLLHAAALAAIALDPQSSAGAETAPHYPMAHVH
jgi:ferritin-like metal-binding protein YciE